MGSYLQSNWELQSSGKRKCKGSSRVVASLTGGYWQTLFAEFWTIENPYFAPKLLLYHCHWCNLPAYAENCLTKSLSLYGLCLLLFSNGTSWPTCWWIETRGWWVGWLWTWRWRRRGRRRRKWWSRGDCSTIFIILSYYIICNGNKIGSLISHCFQPFCRHFGSRFACMLPNPSKVWCTSIIVCHSNCSFQVENSMPPPSRNEHCFPRMLDDVNRFCSSPLESLGGWVCNGKPGHCFTAQTGYRRKNILLLCPWGEQNPSLASFDKSIPCICC